MENTGQAITLNPKARKLLKNYQNPITFFFGLLFRLPSAIFWGIRLKYIDANHCEISIPYHWRSQNPFKSIYFAALAGAGELSTGCLCQVHLAGRGKWSMLVTNLKVEFIKKANEKVNFICSQGQEVYDTLNQVEKTGDPQSLTMVSEGKMQDGVSVAKVYVTWSFKKKS